MPLLRFVRTLPLRAIRNLLFRIAPRSAVIGGAKSGWARWHYTVIDRCFDREQRAFLSGRARYQQSSKTPDGSIAMLRRNVHRLEKGILMKPRRTPFGLDYIAETVDAFIVGMNATNSNIDSTEMAWANDVLSEYFEIHEQQPITDGLLERFRSVQQAVSQPKPMVPYYRNLSTSPPVSFEDFSNLTKHRRSVRWFLPRSVDRNLLDRALEAGVQAPSACNRQPFKFRFFDDPKIVQKVIDIPFGLAGYGHQVPVVAVVIGQQRHFFNERDRHLIYVDASLAVMGFLFALETLCLASCCVNWPDIETNEQKMAELLDLGPDERPIMLIAIGHPDPAGMVARSTKKSLKQLRSFNFE